jgi:dienelactone hydrolase
VQWVTALFTALTLVLPMLLVASAAAAQPRNFVLGALNEQVRSVSDPTQSFALYLPPDFDPARPAPILFLMDPRGRARVPARLFQAAAERFGYIVMSSYNTASDGSVDPNFVAMQAMWADANRWFTLMPGRIYLGGFSGTARTATVLAKARPVITGVVSAGAGFSADVRPSGDTSFLYFGTVGTTDYNFHEMDLLAHALADHNAPHRIETFPGPHSWMTPDVAMRAIEWFELRAMQSGTRPVDAALVNRWWDRDAHVAAERLMQGAWLDASRQYAAMVRDYDGLKATAETKAAAARVAEAPRTRDELTRRKAAARDSINWVVERLRDVVGAYPPGAAKPAMSEANLTAALTTTRLRADAESAVPAVALEARRRLSQLGVQLGFYLPQQAMDQREWARAAFYLSVSMAIDDQSPVAWYLKAQADARLNRPRDAITSLRRAVESGFRDFTLIAANEAFARMRTDSGFAALMADLHRLGDVLDVLTVDRPPARLF